eukprot:765803-Hanusia_phi.AAC.1
MKVPARRLSAQPPMLTVVYMLNKHFVQHCENEDIPACEEHKHKIHLDEQPHEEARANDLEELTSKTENLSLRDRYCPLSKIRSPIKIQVFRRHEIEATIVESMKDVVVKVVWPDRDLDPEDAREHGDVTEERLDAFRREIEMMELAGSHPKIVQLLGATHDSRVIVLEEALSDLHVIIKNQPGGLQLPMISRWTRDVLEALHYLHSVNIVHRDIKPGNILIFDHMVAKLGDFGMAREFVPNEKMAVGREICTLWYRAPELLMGTAKYCPKIDVWAVGCLVLEMLVGNSIFKGSIDDVCQCRRVTHLNYNGDQLHQIFQVCGTPVDHQFLKRMDCFCHFKDWPAYESCLEHILSKYCTVERISQCNQDSEQEVSTSVVCNNWLIILQGLLEINPDVRFSVAEALEIQWLQKEHHSSYKLEGFLSRQEPVVKRVLEDTPTKTGRAAHVRNVDVFIFFLTCWKKLGEGAALARRRGSVFDLRQFKTQPNLHNLPQHHHRSAHLERKEKKRISTSAGTGTMLPRMKRSVSASFETSDFP